MASARNNGFQDRRRALREQQRREMEVANNVFTLLEKEERARNATADAIAELVNVVGKDRAAQVLAMRPAEVMTYVDLTKADADEGSDESTAQSPDAPSGSEKASEPVAV